MRLNQHFHYVVTVATVALFSPLAAQNVPNERGIRIGAGWLNPDGEIRLVRGDRKVVTNEIDGGAALDIEAHVVFGGRWGASMAVVGGVFDHHHVESFTEGEVVSNVNEVKYVSILAGPTLRLPEVGPARMAAGIQLSYNVYRGDFVLTGERELPPGGIGPPNLSVGGWSLRNDLRAGLSLTADIALSERVAVFVTGRRIVTDFGADIVDDPEDDGQDVDLDFDPWGLTAGLRIPF